jgi:hypothetical protein
MSEARAFSSDQRVGALESRLALFSGRVTMEGKQLTLALFAFLLGACGGESKDGFPGTRCDVIGDAMSDAVGTRDAPTGSCAVRTDTYPDDHLFPNAPDPSNQNFSNCAPRCGSTTRFADNFYATDALPAGDCCDDAPTCVMAAHHICPCPTNRGAVNGYRCSCLNGKWSCAIISHGASTCLTKPASADSSDPCAPWDGGAQ